jgi:hypothetical protein
MQFQPFDLWESRKQKMKRSIVLWPRDTWARLQFHWGFIGIDRGGIIGIPGGPFNHRHEPFKGWEKPGRRGRGGGVGIFGPFIFTFHGQIIALLFISAEPY